MRRIKTAAVGVALLGMVLLAGCSGSSSDNAGESSGAAAPADRQDTGSEAADGKSSGSAPQGQDKAAAQPTITRAIIKTGSLTIEAEDVDAQRQKAITVITGLKGQVASEDTGSDDDGKITRANLVLKVPTASYETAIQRLSELGKRMQIHQESSDVTEQVVDVESRIASQRASLERMRTLLAKANTIGEIVSVETELTRREADLESLLAKQKNLALQTELATLALTVDREGRGAGGRGGSGSWVPGRAEGRLGRVHRDVLRAGDRVRCGSAVPGAAGADRRTAVEVPEPAPSSPALRAEPGAGQRAVGQSNAPASAR